MKKLLSVLLAAMLLLAMAGVAGAVDTPTGTITVENLKEWEIVDLYQVIEMPFNETKGQYEGVKWSDAIQTWIDGEHKGLLPENAPDGEENDAKAFYEAMYEYVIQNNVPKAKSDTIGNTTGKLDFSGLTAGSYLVVIHGGARKHQPYLVSLKPVEDGGEWKFTSIPEKVNANEKVKELEINKTVEPKTVGVQDVVTFTIVAEVPKYSDEAVKGDVKYWIKDTMDAGFELVGEPEVKGNSDVLTNTETTTYYTLTKNNNTENTAKYVAFRLDFVYANIKEYDTITVTYKAKVNRNIEVGAKDNDNKAEFEWNSSTTNNYTYGLKLEKYDGRDDKIKLDGVVFNLKDANGKVLYFEKVNGIYYLISEPEKAEDKTDAAKLVTADGGKLQIDGLNAGNYTLVEVVPANGYNVLKEPVLVELIAKDDGPNLDNNNDNAVGAYYQVSVANNKGMSVPSTGGMGTTIFMVAGIAVMACAVVALMLVLKRQKHSEG